MSEEQLKFMNQMVLANNDPMALAAVARGMAGLAITREQVVQVMRELTTGHRTYGGTITFFLGNPEAGLVDKRFLEQDLNRMFGRLEGTAHEERRAHRLAEIARQKQERANQYLHFTASTEGYYVERLCQHLGGNDTRTYWKIIADAHKAAVAQHGVHKVKKIQAKAVELAKAQSRRCGAESRKLVIEGFKLAKQGFEISSLVLP